MSGLRGRARRAPTPGDPIAAIRSREPVTVRALDADGAVSLRAVFDAVAALPDVVRARELSAGDPAARAEVSRAVSSLVRRSAIASEIASAPF